MERPSGSKYSEISTISSGSIPRIVAPSPGGGHEPATMIRPPLIPTPGSDPTDPRTTIVPSCIPAPTLSPA